MFKISPDGQVPGGSSVFGSFVLMTVIGLIFWSSWLGTDQPSTPPLDQPALPAVESGMDLAITAIELAPANPRPNERFAVKVEVENPSRLLVDEYEVTLNLINIATGEKLPLGVINEPALLPGQTTLAYASLGQTPGSYQVLAQISNLPGEDGDLSNNRELWTFIIK
ncbi:MAG TPA: hypothetical protein PKE64_18265 [Anaerolineae bacterium]|nr:hypothetical protein [Anaerolineae bacterium]